MISNIIKKINSQKKIFDYDNKKFILSLKESKDSNFLDHSYELRENEKTTHLPKNNTPCFSPSIVLSHLVSKQICLVAKNKTLINLFEKELVDRQN